MTNKCKVAGRGVAAVLIRGVAAVLVRGAAAVRVSLKYWSCLSSERSARNADSPPLTPHHYTLLTLLMTDYD